MATPREPWRRLMEPGNHWTWLSIVLYGAACLLPAMPPIFGEHPIPGWLCVAVLAITFPPWWANPAYYVSLILCWVRQRRAALIFAVIAALLACSYELMGLYDQGLERTLAEQQIGCYVWIMSLQIHALNLIWQEWLAWRQRTEQLEMGTET